MSSTVYPQGTFCWPELATTDQNAAKGFYGKVFGWGFIDQPLGPDQAYTIFQYKDKPVGAAHAMHPGQVSAGVPPHWMSYVAVSNVDETTAKAKSLGGSVLLEPFDVFSLGRMSVIQDPTGGIFSAWQAKELNGIGVKDEASSLVWTELMTTDADKARDFYAMLIGWTPQVMEMGPMKYTVFNLNNQPAAGMMQMTPDMGAMPSNWTPYFGVDDCDAFVKTAEGAGGKAMIPPSDIPTVGRFSVLQDPQNAVFAVIKFLPRG